MMDDKKIMFETNMYYTDRSSKARFVFEKYKAVLKGRILDVGADQGYLKEHLPLEVHYEGIGFSDQPFIKNIDLEKEKIPHADNSFDCVLCLDVLEHLENIHEIFDELCRVSKEWIIISLPNPWADFMAMLRNGQYKPGRNMKFYGLPLEREEDRHKWFFSATEAKTFVEYRAAKNGGTLYDHFVPNKSSDGVPNFKGVFAPFRKWIFLKVRKIFFRKDLNFHDLYEGTQWYVIQKKSEMSELKGR